jgi:hypothetical protein
MGFGSFFLNGGRRSIAVARLRSAARGDADERGRQARFHYDIHDFLSSSATTSPLTILDRG